MKWAGCAYGALVVLLSLCRTAGGLPWSDGPGFRSLEVLPGTGGKAGFTLMNPQATGVGFTNVLQGDAYLTNAVAHNGSGVAIGDVDGDGWQDIYLCSLQRPKAGSETGAPLRVIPLVAVSKMRPRSAARVGASW